MAKITDTFYCSETLQQHYSRPEDRGSSSLHNVEPFHHYMTLNPERPPPFEKQMP